MSLQKKTFCPTGKTNPRANCFKIVFFNTVLMVGIWRGFGPFPAGKFLARKPHGMSGFMLGPFLFMGRRRW